MVVVADTSPLNYLVRLGLIDVLHRRYGRVLVPQAVLTELRHNEAPPEVRAWAANPPSWLETVRVHQVDSTWMPQLGPGEREAISMAQQMQADVLLIDEWLGRQEAEKRHIAVAGTLAILLQASLEDDFDFPAALKRLRLFGFRIAPSLLEVVLERYAQSKE